MFTNELKRQAEDEKSHLILTLFVNFVTVLIVVIGAAAFFRKKTKNHNSYGILYEKNKEWPPGS